MKNNKNKLMDIQIAYIGGGSKEWARVFMGDLALAKDIQGTIRLYDIDMEEAQKNAIIGRKLCEHQLAISKWNYIVCEQIEQALINADFVVISILPGTFEEMRIDVHTPEKYGIFQSVGDSVGPGGVLRAMRTVPLYEQFASHIKHNCPNAWVINLTNPMSICVKTLYDCFPRIKAFGCCHEVFNAQNFILKVLKEINGLHDVKRQDIYTNVLGINHFTWINEAKYQGVSILESLSQFIDIFYEVGYNADGIATDYKTNPNKYANRVKMDLYKKYGVLGAAGDRHLVEFLPNNWYLKTPQMVNDWMFALTTVDFRENKQNNKRIITNKMINNEIEVIPEKSREEVIDMIRSILGLNSLVTNVNLPNIGQISNFPIGSIVETNASFAHDTVKPLFSGELPNSVTNLVLKQLLNQEDLYQAIKKRDLLKIFQAFMNESLCSILTYDDGKKLFKEMVNGTKKYLQDYYDLLALELI